MFSKESADAILPLISGIFIPPVSPVNNESPDWISFKNVSTDLVTSPTVLSISPIFAAIRFPVSSSTEQIGTKGAVPLDPPPTPPDDLPLEGSHLSIISSRAPNICPTKPAVILLKRHLIISLISIFISRNWNLWFGNIISAKGPIAALIFFDVYSKILLKIIFIYFAILGANLSNKDCIFSATPIAAPAASAGQLPWPTTPAIPPIIPLTSPTTPLICEVTSETAST